MEEYILYVAQDSNFQTRSMLIPAKDFLASRKDDYQLLIDNSRQNYKFNLDGQEYVIDNLLIDNIIWSNGCGHHEEKVYTKLCHDLTQYADGMDDYYLSLNDKIWYDKSKTNLCKGFNHVKNFVFCKKKMENKGFNIINAFLVLQTDDGKLYMPEVDTVEEMYEKYYSGPY